MPKDKSIHKVLVIGSGPIVIGQAAEFDYAGAQACRVLREEGVNVVLVNSNPATIMTDKNLADEIYLEPLTAETVRRVIEKERPDGLRICGVPRLSGGTVDACGDHRIAMAAAVAACAASGPVTILGAEAVNKSYPGFWRDYAQLNDQPPCHPAMEPG